MKAIRKSKKVHTIASLVSLSELQQAFGSHAGVVRKKEHRRRLLPRSLSPAHKKLERVMVVEEKALEAGTFQKSTLQYVCTRFGGAGLRCKTRCWWIGLEDDV